MYETVSQLRPGWAGRQFWPALLVLIGLLFGASALTPVETARGDAGDRPPVVLMFHSGGFLIGSPASLTGAVDLAQRLGARPKPIAYPLGDPIAALRFVRQAARSYPPQRRVYAYGESAGGTLAVRLAQERGLVDRAAAYSPVAKTSRLMADQPWGNPWAELTKMDLAQHRVRVPTLALALDDDELLAGAFRRQIIRWAKADRSVKLWKRPGPHLDGPHFASNRSDALRWLLRR